MVATDSPSTVSLNKYEYPYIHRVFILDSQSIF